MAEAIAVPVERKPWHVCPPCPKGCGAIGCLRPYNPSGWYGPMDANLFCPACGTGWIATEDELEIALIAETWWAAFEDSGLSEEMFLAAFVEGPVNCGVTCFTRGCQRPELHFGYSAKVCSPKFHPPSESCNRCRFLLDRMAQRERIDATYPPSSEKQITTQEQSK